MSTEDLLYEVTDGAGWKVVAQLKTIYNIMIKQLKTL